MSIRFQGSSSAKYSVGRQFDVIVCAVGVTAAAIRRANAATDRLPAVCRLARCRVLPAADRRAGESIAAGHPNDLDSRLSTAESSSFQSNNNSKSTAAATDGSNTAPAQPSQGQKSQPPANRTRRPRPLPTTASLRRKTERRPTPRTRPIPIRLRNRTRQIPMRWRRPPIPAKSRDLGQPTIPRNNRRATRKAKTTPRRPTPRQQPPRRPTRPIQPSRR